MLQKHEEVLKSEKYNRKLLVTKGEVPADRLDAHNELATRFDKYHSNASKFGYFLDIEMPALRQLPAGIHENIF